eukprot:767662-Hanusia_phi.AAC.4
MEMTRYLQDRPEETLETYNLGEHRKSDVMITVCGFLSARSCMRRFIPTRLSLNITVSQRISHLCKLLVLVFALIPSLSPRSLAFSLTPSLLHAPALNGIPSAHACSSVLNNHLRFKILYHSISKEKGFNQMAQGSKTLDGQDNLIVGFHVHPYSIAHTYQGEWKESCAPNCPLTSCLGDGMFAEHSPQKIEPSKGREGDASEAGRMVKGRREEKDAGMDEKRRVW